MKEASGNLAQIAEIIRNRPENFTVLSGDDALTLAVLAEGGDGVISVTANVVPRLAAGMCDSFDEGRIEEAREIAHRLADWTAAAFVESNPIPAKAALTMMGRISNVLRLPLVPMKESHNDMLKSALRAAGALE